MMTLLDTIFSNVTQITNTIHSAVFKTDYADHYSIFCASDLVIGSRNSKFINKRDLSKKNISNIKIALNKYNWQALSDYRLIAFKIHFLIFKTYSLNVS